MPGPAAWAATASYSNTNFGTADASTITRTMNVAAGTLPAGDIITDVNIAIDFRKVDGNNISSCTSPGSGNPYNNEIQFTLAHPGGTSRILVPANTYTGTTQQPRVVVTLDDEAATVVSGVPTAGTFRPVNSLSVFDGLSPFGTWTLSIRDTAGADILCFYATTMTIVTATPGPGVTINPTTVAVTEGGATANYTMVLNFAPTASVTVTADPDAQCNLGNGAGNPVTRTFTTGNWATAQSITVTAVDDNIDEASPHPCVITHSSSSADAGYNGLTIAGVTANVTDNDPAPAFTINDVTVTEGNSGTVNATFTVTLTSTFTSNITVNWATANGTATSPSDYAANSGTLTFPSGGALTQTVTVVVNGDTLDEGASEVFLVNLSGAVNATITDGQGIGTITDDDNAPTISISDVNVTEGNSGTVNANFTVSLSNGSSSNVTVNRVTANNTATAPSDYTALSSATLTFLPGGALTQTVTVVVNGDTLDEGASETFFVNLSSAVNATIGDAQGIGTITDDDNAPTISISDVNVTEGNSGTVNATFTVSLSNGSSSVVTVNYATADGSATAPADYSAASGTVTFNPTVLVQTVTVVVNGDTIDEGASEQFLLNLFGAVNASIGDNQGIGTITDDDNAPTVSINDVSVTEGNSGTTNMTFTVSLNSTATSTITLDWATANGTASSPSDYAANSGTLTFPSGGALTQNVTVVVNGDTLNEPTETLFVNLTNLVNATFADAQGLGTITNDDPLPSLSINDVTVTEGNSGTVNATFTVTLSTASGQTVSVDYATANDSAVAPGDYASDSGTLTFLPGGSLTQTVTVVVNGDITYEMPSEQFFVNLSGATNATISDAQGLGTITDDDNYPTVSIDDVTVTEGDTGTVNATFTVSLTSTPVFDLTVDVNTANDTAAAPGDFTALSVANLTFLAGGATTQQVTVVVNGDTIDEGASEQFFVNLSNLTNGFPGDMQGVGTITDDDNAPVISINDVTVTEGDAGTVNAIFTVSLNSTATSNITVNYATADDSAIEPNDYTTTFNTLTFAPGSALTQTITVEVNGDTIDEGASEQFFVNLSGAVNATIADNQGIGTITDDDNAPVISINDVTVTEGDSGTVNAVFTVSLSNASASIVTVDYVTANDTAIAPADFTAIAATTLTFNPGVLSLPITVVVNGDTIDEGASEQFFVDLASTGNATIGDAQGVGTITDDDNAPVISINDVTVTEGDSGTVNATFTVSLSNASASIVTVDYAIANDTAVAPGDFTALLTTTLTFNPGVLSLPITVVVNGDTIDEGASEQFFVVLASAGNATIGDNQGVGTITDDDNAPVIAINDVTVTEGDSGTVNATFTVSLSNASASVVTVDYVTANNTAVAPGDFTALPTTTLTFNPGALSLPITVVVNGDTIDEGASEQFFVDLASAGNATIGDAQGVGTITDDDNAPVISINDVTVTEGDTGMVNATFTVSVNSTATSDITVNYATTNDTAAAPADFDAVTSTTLTFVTGGSLTQTLTVVINGDTIDEGLSEQFFVDLASAVNATIGDNQGVGTITDDDNAPVISINNVTVTEGDSGTVNATFTVSLSNASASIVTVNYATANDTAAAPADFTAIPTTTLTFNPGVLSLPITVVVNGDTIDESASEQFFVDLASASNATIGDAQGVGTITDDDNAPVISINDVTVTEGDSGTVNATFTVSLSNASASVVTVDYATANDTAAASADFTALPTTTLTFNPSGALSQTITVVVNGDTIDEGVSEQFFVNLSGETNSTVGDNQGIGTITDDDNAPVIAINDVTVTEGDSGTVNAVFTVSVNSTATSDITVNYATANDTAAAPDDFDAVTSTTLTFVTGGSLTQTLTVVVNGDTIDEGASEQFFVNLSGAVNATITDNQGIGTITDDDNAPVISINDVTVTEGNSGTVNATFTVSLSNASASIVTVDYATANDTAIAPADFTAIAATTLTFNPGGALSQTITVVVNGDTIDEGASEQFFVNLSGETNSTVGDNQGIGTITDDDNAPVIAINDVTVTEGDSGTVNATFTVSVNSTATSDITVNYATANDTAAAPDDFDAVTSTTLTFVTGGSLSQTLTVVVNGDTIDEGLSEQFFVDLASAVNATIGDNQGVGTITDDDNAPVISINDATVTEGDSGTVNATFTVSLSNASASVVTVDYVTANDTAAAPADFTAIAATTLTFNPGGALSQTVTVEVNGDTIDEGASEQFFVDLASAGNATIGDAQGVGTITDDDNAPVISINDVIVTEGDAGTVNVTFTVSLSNASASIVTVDYVTANDTAAAPADFTALPTTTLTFNPGVLSLPITVVVNGDTSDEGASEQFFVNLSSATNSTVGDNQGIGTITDDDNAPVISINDVIVTEGDSGTVNATFTVSLSNASASIVTVDYVTANDTAVTPNDYVAVPPTTLTFNPGEALTQTLTVVVNSDTIDEGASEQFFVNLSSATNSTIGDAQGIGTITDDDNAPVISINDVTVTEGDSGTINATFTVSLSNASASIVTVDYATANDTAIAPADFTAIAATTLTFNPGGALSQTATVVVNGDTIDEGASEQFFVNLSSATNSTIGDAQGVGTITDDDNAPVIAINDVTVTEGNTGTVNATFTVSLSNASASIVTVNYVTANDTAVAPNDYVAVLSTTLTFNPGAALSQTVTVAVNGDYIFEGISERFFVNLSGATNSTIGDNQGIGTITDDDTPAFTVTPVSADTAIVENPQPAPSQRYIFTVRLQTDPTAPVTLNLAVSNSQIRVGRPGGPFGNTLSLTFVPSGTTPTTPNTVWNVTQTVEVMAADDITIETLVQSAQLTFAIQAGSAAEYVTLAIPTLTVSVRDNDGADSIAMFNGTTGQASLINTLQDLPSGAAYNTYTPGASVSGQWVMGDWNDDGLETPGVYGNGVFAYTNDAGPTSNWVGIWIGLLNRPPVVGRFDANYGNDCIGVVDSGVFPPWGTAFALYFTCDLTHGPTPPLAYQWLSVILPDELGYLGAHQFAAGDFNGDGIDTMAIRRGEAIAFTNVPPTTSNSMFDLAQYIGNPALSGGDVVAGQYGNLVSGDWNTNGIDSFGLFYPAGVLYYRNDLEWNTSIYIRQRMAQPVGPAALAVTWHPQGGATLGAGESTGGVEETPSTTKTYRPVRIESDDARVQRTGQWAVQSTPAASGGRYVYSGASTDDILTLEFEGTSVEVIYLEGQSLGSFTIVVDDIAVRTVIATQSETAFDRSTVINYLEEGVHTLQIVPIRGVVAIDAFVVTVAQ